VAKGKNNGKKVAAKKGGNKEMLLVGSKVKAAIKEANCNTAGDALDGLNDWVHWLIQQATQRADRNGRKTVRAHDFMVG
jgi:histone H3/H4